jgi:putative nucleotidyltransferase with HDIG domain
MKKRPVGFFNSVNRRILAIIGAVTAIFLAGIAYWGAQERTVAFNLKHQIAKERKSTLQRSIDADKENLSGRTADYSTWSDLVRFVDSPNRIWGVQNLDYTFGAYGHSFVAVYDGSGRLVYRSGSDKDAKRAVSKLNFDPRSLLKSSKTIQSGFEKANGQLVEVCAATVHSSGDKNRSGTRKGVLVFGRTLSESVVSTMAKSLGSQIKVLNADGVLDRAASSADQVDNLCNIVNFVPLKGMSGETSATLQFTTESPAIHKINESSKNATQFVAAFSLGLLVLLATMLKVWIVRPLAIARHGLETDNPIGLDKLERDPTEFGQIATLIRKFHEQREEIRAANQELQAAIEELGSMNGQLETRVEQRTKELADAYEATIEGWSRAMEVRDHETQGHCERVTAMAMSLGQSMGLEQHDMIRLKRGALLHDIGKMGIPDGILLKPGRLTPDERSVMEKHPTIAYEMLRPIKFLEDSLDVPLFHHEKWDGTGYPYRLAGERIPLNARIFAVADVWDAMRSDRPYREAWTEERTRSFIIENSGTHFDPEVVKAYLNLNPVMLDEMRRRSLGVTAENDEKSQKAA